MNTQIDQTGVSTQILRLDAAAETDRIAAGLREIVFKRLKRRGAVVGLSGGIDSSVTAALCARSLGKDRVLGLFMPESESDGDSLRLGRLLADFLGIQTVTENITPVLEAAGCYRRRDEAIRSVMPDYGLNWKNKLTISDATGGAAYAITYLVVESPEGVRTRLRLTAPAYLAIVAASNFKQRTRKMMEYCHADRLQYAVAGTPNRLEYDQGFFVKAGDGAADVKPIAHLYKTQVYQMAEFLNIPEEIRRRPPTTDTFSLPQSQDEFYFSVPYPQMDLCLYAFNHGISAEQIAGPTRLTVEQVNNVFRDIEGKRRATQYLHLPPVLLEPGREQS